MVERLVDEHHHFEVDSLPHRQPVKLPQHRRDVLSSTSSSDQPSCRVLYRLQALDQTVGNAAQKSVTVVQSAGPCLVTVRQYNTAASYGILDIFSSLL